MINKEVTSFLLIMTVITGSTLRYAYTNKTSGLMKCLQPSGSTLLVFFMFCQHTRKSVRHSLFVERENCTSIVFFVCGNTTRPTDSHRGAQLQRSCQVVALLQVHIQAHRPLL